MGTKMKKRHLKIYGLSLLGGLFIGLSILAASGEMSSLEQTVFLWLYGASDGWRWFALLVTQLGSIWMVMGVVGLLFVTRWNPMAALRVLRNSVITYAFVELAKFLIDRPRPMHLLHDISAREVVVFGNGFPSGHTALATVVALTVFPYVPRRFRWLIVVWIVLVAWSRVYLGVHAPLDVLGGFIIGAFVVLVMSLLADRPTRRRSEKR